MWTEPPKAVHLIVDSSISNSGRDKNTPVNKALNTAHCRQPCEADIDRSSIEKSIYWRARPLTVLGHIFSIRVLQKRLNDKHTWIRLHRHRTCIYPPRHRRGVHSETVCDPRASWTELVQLESLLPIFPFYSISYARKEEFVVLKHWRGSLFEIVA